MKPVEVLKALLGILPGARPFGIVAEFDDPRRLLDAALAMRRSGYRRFDAHSPFPIHGMDRAMRLRRSLVPWLALGGGLFGGAGVLTLMLWINVIDYPLRISGKPYASVPAFIPITFEMTVLFAAFATFGGMLMLNFLPMLYHPLLKCRRFARVTSDGFFLSVEACDPKFDPDRTRRELAAIGGKNIELLEP